MGDVIEKMLMSLEEDGFIKIEEDENGEKGTRKGSLMKKIICIVATVVAISGCTAHGGGLDNRTKGAILGGVAGGFVGNQFGRGSGNALQQQH